MRWEDERYVRLYTRDTTDWLALSWKAQGLFALILRKVDRAGILMLGKHGKRGLAAHVGGAGAWSELEPHLEELLADGCVQFRDDMLVVPNFIKAQESVKTDAARKREQRERDRAAALHESQNVTPESRNVTESHTPSRAVTPGHAESLLPTRAEPPEPHEQPPEHVPDRSAKRAESVRVLSDGDDLIKLAATLRDEGSDFGRAVCERAAKGWVPTGPQLAKLREIQAQRAALVERSRATAPPPEPPARPPLRAKCPPMLPPEPVAGVA